jgi:hypothetical protein
MADDGCGQWRIDGSYIGVYRVGRVLGFDAWKVQIDVLFQWCMLRIKSVQVIMQRLQVQSRYFSYR